MEQQLLTRTVRLSHTEVRDCKGLTPHKGGLKLDIQQKAHVPEVSEFLKN